MREIELGALFRKVAGRGQPVWRVAAQLRHTVLPHVKLTQVDAPATQMTVSVVTLTDRRFFQRVTD